MGARGRPFDQTETQSQKGNDEGWAHELGELKEYLEAA